MPNDPTTANSQRQRQLQMLAAALLRCLPARGPADDARAELARSLEQSLRAWHGGGDGGDDALDRVVTIMRKAAAESGMAKALTRPEATAAFARTLVAQAREDIAREARRAGHQTSFDALQPWLEAPLPTDIASALARQLEHEPAHLQLALSRLRRRFRQRIEAGLALWSVTDEQRKRLRRQLHAALSPGESQS